MIVHLRGYLCGYLDSDARRFVPSDVQVCFSNLLIFKQKVAKRNLRNMSLRVAIGGVIRYSEVMEMNNRPEEVTEMNTEVTLFDTHDGHVACKTHRYGDRRWRRMADHERTDWMPSDKWEAAQPFQPFGDYEAQIQGCPLEEREIVVYRCEICGEG
mgnify:CR=1 FL=1